MLTKIEGQWVNLSLLEFTHDGHPDEPEPGAVVTYRGEPGFVCLEDSEDQLVLVNSCRVTALRAARGGTEVETATGRTLVVHGSCDWVASIFNHAKLRAA